MASPKKTPPRRAASEREPRAGGKKPSIPPESDSPAKATRRRRDPETARAEILDAAERVLSTRPPDQVGLKDVAEVAGVSHGLVSHYFGTYAELVEEVLVRRHRAIRH